MVMSGAMFAQFTGFGGASASPLGAASGSMVSAMGGFLGATGDVNWAQFDFSKGNNKMTQQLTTTGWAGNLGFVWKASPVLSIGGVYHGKTSLKDMEGDGAINMSVAVGGVTQPNMAVKGTLRVVNFQWPETYGLGLAYQVNDRTMLVADYKNIGWAKVMKDFHMHFTASGNSGMLAGFNGTEMDATLYQNWKDQSVYQFGGSYKMSDVLTLRAGVSLSDNPIPDAYMNPLFPATVKDHVMAGFGYAVDKTSSIDFSFAFAPKVSVTNPNMGVTTTHSQTNWQLMYGQRF
jgi:long-chain fatty acid transport protein